MTNIPKILWQPDKNFIDQSNINGYRLWLKNNKGLVFDDYHSMWIWSTKNISEFWLTILEFFEVNYDGTFENVLEGVMPDVKWFEGISLNYTEHIFRHKTKHRPAIIYKSESTPTTEISWQDLEHKVSVLQRYLKSIGVKQGDTVVGFLPNIPEATIAFLAANSMGAVWSSCSPDFGASSVVDRFQQIEPKVLFIKNSYSYNGKTHDKKSVVTEIINQLPSLIKTIEITDTSDRTYQHEIESIAWNEVMNEKPDVLEFERVPFSHPIWVLYSSGTTGQPKAITHSVGGSLLEHLKYLTFHNDVHPGDRFFWYTTTGWMMWNYVQASMLAGATIVLYDGSPSYPDINVLWDFVEVAGINHFGTSAPFIMTCLKKNINPGKTYNLDSLKSISSTGSPLPSEGFSWIYQNIDESIWLCSMSGGTDVCTAFVGGCPLEPVYEGEIQCAALGAAVFSFSDNGDSLINAVGEMVITEPMPSMPLFFWNDIEKKRYRDSYFDVFENIWRHGDWLRVTERNTLVILGRSDATLNRHGIRIGTAEIYNVINQIAQIKDSLIVNLELAQGKNFMPLFVVLNDNESLSDQLISEIKHRLSKTYTVRHVPDEIIVAPDIPYTISGKKMEAPVKKILMGMSTQKSANTGVMKNPESLDFFEEFARNYLNS